MNKIKVVVPPYTFFENPWFIGLIEDYIDIVPYSDAHWNIGPNTIFYFNSYTHRDSPIVESLLAQGIPVLCDSNSEIPTEFLAGKYAGHRHFYIMSNPNWFWYNESMMQHYRGDHNFVPSPTYSKLALMPIGISRAHRINLINSLGSALDDFIWSSAGQGIFLPNGGDPLTDCNQQRAFVPQWYNDTCFSLVAETEVNASDYIFITEKTFKPIAYRHPLLLWAQPGTLARLHELGFETFENLFDESYDTVIDNDIRMDIILKNVAEYKKIPYSKETLDKLQHNHSLYFDQELIERRVVDEIIIPLVEYVNKT